MIFWKKNIDYPNLLSKVKYRPHAFPIVKRSFPSTEIKKKKFRIWTVLLQLLSTVGSLKEEKAVLGAVGTAVSRKYVQTQMSGDKPLSYSYKAQLMKPEQSKISRKKNMQ